MSATNDENLKFTLAKQMQSFASIVLNTLLDKRFYNNYSTPSPSSSLTNQDQDQPGATNSCHRELIQLSSSALKNEHWALKVFDSNGRLQSGLMSGAIFNSIGNYEQCLSATADADHRGRHHLIDGSKYCLAQIDLSQEAHQLSLLTDLPTAMFAGPVTGTGVGRYGKLGLCVPATCSTKDIGLLANHILGSTLSPSLSVRQLDCFGGASRLASAVASWSADDLAFGLSLVLIVFVVGACTSATILDSLEWPANDRDVDGGGELDNDKRGRQLFGRRGSWWWKLVKIFSLIEGWQRLTTPRTISATARLVDLRALDGLRVVSMLWIIIIHSYNFGLQWLQFDNVHQVDDIYKNAWIQWIANGTFSVDNFYLASGFLAWFSIFGRNNTSIIRCGHSVETHKATVPSPPTTRRTKLRLSKTTITPNEEQLSTTLADCCSTSIGGDDASEPQAVRHVSNHPFSWAMMISNTRDRYLRLAPTLMVMILFSVGLLSRLSYGPNWSTSTTMFDQWCRQNWFVNALMLHNIIRTQNMCFSHSWYVAVDLQLFILLQLLVYMSSKRLLQGIDTKRILCLAMVIAQIGVAGIVYVNQLPGAPLVPAKSLESILNYYGLVYIKPYYWFSSYLFGALLAACIHRVAQGDKTSGRRAQIVKLQVYLVPGIQLASGLLMAGLILSTLPYFTGHWQRSDAQSAVYVLLARPMWALCSASILFFAIFRSSRFIAYKNLPARLVGQFLAANIWLPLAHVNYSVYLLHPVVMAVFYGSRTETFQFTHSLLLYFTLGNIVLTYAAALVLHLFVELPFRAAIEQLTGKRRLASAVAATAATQTRAQSKRMADKRTRLAAEPASACAAEFISLSSRSR